MADLDGTDAHLSNAISLEGLAVEQEPFPLEGSPTLAQTLVPPPPKHGAGQGFKVHVGVQAQSKASLIATIIRPCLGV